MVKKIVLGTLLVGLIVVLAAGAVIRTIDKTGNVAEARGLGEGQGHGPGASDSGEEHDCDEAGGHGAGGQGQGGAMADESERQYANYDGQPAEWAIYEGSVAQAPAAGVDMVVKVDSGEQIVVGTGPGYMEEQGFTLQAGELIRVEGYWEGDEFKAAQVTRLRDGQTVTLRDQAGRPAWAGGGRNAQSVDSGGEGYIDAPGDGAGSGQAEVQEWLTLSGTVLSVDEDALVVQTAESEVVVENRPWWFAQELGFSAQAGDRVTLTGFYENGVFEAGQIDDTTTGQTVRIRDENGRPGWAGRGRRGG